MVTLSTPKTILVIGIGPHSQKNHIPVLLMQRAAGRIGTIVGVDTFDSSQEITKFNIKLGDKAFPILYVQRFEGSESSLPRVICDSLNLIQDLFNFDGVLVATHPSVHRLYTQWAVSRGLNVLLDKPISVHRNCSTDPGQAVAINSDFLQLACLYSTSCLSKRLLLSVHCQRRYHPAFMKMRKLITEVASQTGCPVTHIQSFHSDGQWRMPNELIDLSYHSYDCGYGKAAHSGYHFFDIVPWLMEGAEVKGKEIDSVTVHAHAVRPNDLLGQLTLSDYERIFPGFTSYGENTLKRRMETFGEVDISVSAAFKSEGRTITLATINLLHNGFSQRGNMVPNANLYKGNGRVRHETHIIHQGPFQAIYFSSLQTNDGNGSSCSIGSRDHVDIDVFRNSAFHTPWETHRRYDFSSLTMSGDKFWTPTQATARERSINEFIDFLYGKLERSEVVSDFMSHKRSSVLMSAVYLSLAQQWSGGDSTTTVGFSPSKQGQESTEKLN